MMRRGQLLKSLMLVAAISLTAACGDEAGGPGTGDPGDLGKSDLGGDDWEPARTLSFLSYNTGLAYGAVSLAEERRSRIVSALQATTADVLCLQEVWDDEDAQLLREALADTHPFSWQFITEDDSEKKVSCGLWGTFKLKRCTSKYCDPEGISASECVQTLCQEEYDALGQDCQICLAANTASPLWCAIWPGARNFAWDGRNGLLLISRFPINDPTYTPYDSLLIYRGMISATIEGVRVQCTHLSADLSAVPYPQDRTFTSWEEEHAAQLELLATTSDDDTCTVLLGDMNAGPETETLEAELAANWSLFRELGYEEPWDDRVCTWCAENPLSGSSADRQIDHIFMKSCPGARIEYGRVLDMPVELLVDKEYLDTRLSDHYGLLGHLGLPE